MSQTSILSRPSVLRKGVPYSSQMEEPPSYPMMAADMQMDLFTPVSEAAISETGVVRNAPHQSGNWVFHPAYGRSLHFVYDLKDRVLWSRTLLPAQDAGWDLSTVDEAFSGFLVDPEIRWLHCLRCAEATNMLKYAIVILDFMHPTIIHSFRRDKLLKSFDPLGVKTQPVCGKVYLVPEFPETVSADLWCGLHLMNSHWNSEFYSGIVAKNSMATYSMQKMDSHKLTLRWQFHRFEEPKIHAT